MSVKRVLVAASASLAGLLFLAGAGSSAWAQQRVLLCNIDGVSVPAHSSAVVTCLTNMISMGAISSPSEDLRVEYADASGQTTDPLAVIDSVEATLNANNGANVSLDFMDVALSPYAHVAGGGGKFPNYATFGGVNSPNIDLLRSTITAWTVGQGFGPTVNVNFELQVFVTNNATTPQFVVGTLRVIASINTL